MRPRSSRKLSFDAFLDDRLEDARILCDAYRRLHRLRDLHAEAILLDADMRDDPDFMKLTIGAPPVDRTDPLGLLRGLQSTG